jgi:hypothetical protein
MSEMELLLKSKVFRVPGLVLRQVCRTFATKPLPAQYSVISKVSCDIFELFLSALQGEVIDVTKANFKEISVLCDEFGFELNSPSYRFGRVEFVIEEMRVQIERLSNQVTALQTIPSVMAELSNATAHRSIDLTKQDVIDFDDCFGSVGLSRVSQGRFKDHFGLSGDFRRVSGKGFQNSVAGQSRWF